MITPTKIKTLVSDLEDELYQLDQIVVHVANRVDDIAYYKEKLWQTGVLLAYVRKYNAKYFDAKYFDTPYPNNPQPEVK